jgi:hypothetical protein
MNPRYYHTPVTPGSTRVRCPVCHEAVYSRAGIHPQCAVKQADPPRPKDKKGAPGQAGETPSETGLAGASAIVEPPIA